MDELLAQLVRAERRPGIALAIGAGALVAAAVLVFALRGGAPLVTCEAPARDVATVWSPVMAVELHRGGQGAHAAVLEAAFRGWQAERTRACTTPLHVQQAQLQCLDGVL